MILIYNHSICSHVLDQTPELERVKYSLFDRIYINLMNPHPYGAWRFVYQKNAENISSKT